MNTKEITKATQANAETYRKVQHKTWEAKSDLNTSYSLPGGGYPVNAERAAEDIAKLREFVALRKAQTALLESQLMHLEFNIDCGNFEDFWASEKAEQEALNARRVS